MCGFVGGFDLGGGVFNLRILGGMRRLLRHRGPDDAATCAFDVSWTRLQIVGADEERAGTWGGGLGFNRLSILDTSESGRQPMLTRDGQSALVFNGEIYNAFDLRPELESAGWGFRSRSDTEVILAGFATWGLERTLERLNGMFGIAFVDLRERTVHLVRDRLGIKPLYYCEVAGSLLFASEAKAFLAHPEFQPRLEATRLDEFLAFRYCAQEGSLLAGVHQVRPAEWLTFGAAGRKSRTYWAVPDPGDQAGASLSTSEELLAGLLERSVESQLLSDVPLGCQLSGGVDSSLVNLYAQRHSGERLEAFSVVIPGSALSEEAWVDEASSIAGVRTHKSALTDEVFGARLESATWHLDQPLNHPNSIGLFLLAEDASKRVKVLLSGEGADELLGGYSRFLFARLRPLARRVLPRTGLSPRVREAIDWRFDPKVRDDIDWFVWSSSYAGREQSVLLRPEADLAAVGVRRRSLFEEGQGSFLARSLKYELRTYLVDLLLRQDKMTMAHSVENRVPFLDHTLVEAVRLRIPLRHLVSCRPRLGHPISRNTKVALKRVARRHFSRRLVYRGKSGFGIPLTRFLSAQRVRELVEDRLLPGTRSRGALDARVVAGLWQRRAQLSGRELEALWVALSLELWAGLFLDRQGLTAFAPRNGLG